MNKYLWIRSILIALLIISVYIGKDMESKNRTNSDNKWVVGYFILYYATKKQFINKLKENPSYEVTFKESFQIGFRICYTSAMIASAFYYLIPNLNSAQYSASKLLRTLDVFFGPLIIGTIASLITALVLPRIKININVDEKTISNRWMINYAIIIISILTIIVLLFYLNSTK